MEHYSATQEDRIDDNLPEVFCTWGTSQLLGASGSTLGKVNPRQSLGIRGVQHNYQGKFSGTKDPGLTLWCFRV